MIKRGRKYIHTTGSEVYVNGKALLLPDNIPIIVYVILDTGQAKACREDLFLQHFSLAKE